MDITPDLTELFSLSSHTDLPPPALSPAYAASSLAFLESIHRHKSEVLKALVMESGWPAAAAIRTDEAEHAEASAFMIIVHADYDGEFQRLCHALMVQHALKGRGNLGFLAFLTDRILCNEGKHQRFGTQIREVVMKNGGDCFVPKPIEDTDIVDELRKQAGIEESLSDYYMRVNNGDLLLYRPLLNGYGEELEIQKQNKVVNFPKSGEKPN
jgi:hypothetical protein